MVIDVVALKWAIVILIVFLIAWFILAKNLLKSESKLIKVNMADRYKDVGKDTLKKYNIDYDEFKRMVCQKIVDIHDSLTNYNIDVLKDNLTDDLYNYYVSELDKSKNNNYSNVMKDFDIVNFKVYNVDDSYDSLKIDVYLNVKIVDYVVEIDTNKCIKGNDRDKVDFEFELTFIKKNNEDKLCNQFVMSKKNCINEMLIDKKDRN